MRKITRELASAWRNHTPWKKSNTETDGQSVWLHGNSIAKRDPDTGHVFYSLAGWSTNTTRERLNGILPSRWYVAQVKGDSILFGPHGYACALDDFEWFEIEGRLESAAHLLQESYNVA
jgi:hypothetical protein